MYAVIRTGGKQYKVKAGDVLRVEKLEKKIGDEFDLTDVLFLSGQSSVFGSPLVKDAKVSVVVTQQWKAPKIIVFKRRRRQGYRRFNGHRQPFTELFVKAIVGPNGEKEVTDQKAPVIDREKNQARKAAAAQEAATQPKSERKAAKAAAPKKAAAKKAAPKKAATKTKSSGTAKKKAAKKTK
jgi:large subunit ribosomal protein L21